MAVHFRFIKFLRKYTFIVDGDLYKGRGSDVVFDVCIVCK